MPGRKYKIVFLPIDEGNRYSRGDLFLLFVAVYKFYLLILVGVSMQKERGQLYSIHWYIFVLTIFVVAGTVTQLFFPAVYSFWPIVTLALFLYYLLLSEHDGKLDFLTGLYNRAAPVFVITMSGLYFVRESSTSGHQIVSPVKYTTGSFSAWRTYPDTGPIRTRMMPFPC